MPGGVTALAEEHGKQEKLLQNTEVTTGNEDFPNLNPNVVYLCVQFLPPSWSFALLDMFYVSLKATLLTLESASWI